ncbi:MAG: Gfo/Idh/MocA family oxidoreductase [Bacilli bacterium]|nr:Gfo/Idh/MocA family oxidoreductase [Bacilli bacterium]
MYKVVFLGCENSHANGFLKYIKNEEQFKDIEVVGVYSDDEAAKEKLANEFGVYSMKSFDEFVGKVDGVVLTNRHGKYHLPFAKPYLEAGGVKAIFLDKPLTITKEDSLEFKKLITEKGVRFCGGSCCKYLNGVSECAKGHKENLNGKTIGGYFRAPVSLTNAYGGYRFYCQHLIDMVSAAFGYAKEVKAKNWGDKVDVDFIYDTFIVHGLFVDGHYTYYMNRQAEDGVQSYEEPVTADSPCFHIEFEEFHNLLNGIDGHLGLDDFFASVPLTIAIEESMNSGETVKVDYEGFLL